MTENKRFEVVMNEFDEVEYIMDKVAMEDRDFAEFIDFVEDVCKENEQLKQQGQSINKDLTQIMLILLDDDIASKLTETELKAFERLSKFKGDVL